jgi:hypothetical protein
VAFRGIVQTRGVCGIAGRIGVSVLFLWLTLLALVDASRLENSVGRMGVPQWDWTVDGVTELRCEIFPYRPLAPENILGMLSFEAHETARLSLQDPVLNEDDARGSSHVTAEQVVSPQLSIHHLPPAD